MKRNLALLFFSIQMFLCVRCDLSAASSECIQKSVGSFVLKRNTDSKRIDLRMAISELVYPPGWGGPDLWFSFTLTDSSKHTGFDILVAELTINTDNSTISALSSCGEIHLDISDISRDGSKLNVTTKGSQGRSNTRFELGPIASQGLIRFLENLGPASRKIVHPE